MGSDPPYAAPASDEAPVDDTDQAPSSSVRRRRRRRLPHFGLKTAFVVAIGFCLFFGWVGRNLYEARQDQAALQTIQRTGDDFFLDTRIHFENDDWSNGAFLKLEERGLTTLVRTGLGLEERPKIRRVQLGVQQADDASLRSAMQAMQRFPEIRDVTFIGGGFDDDAVAALRALPNFESLLLIRTNVTGEGLASLAGNRTLTRLHIAADDRLDGLATGAAELKSLTTVVIASAPVDRADMQSIASLPRLEQLMLNDVRLSEEPDVLLPLEHAPALKHLTVSLTSDEGETRRALPRIEGLETVMLFGVSDETLANWPATPTLREASLNQPITPRGAVDFSAAHPACDVVHFGPNEACRLRGGEIAP